MNVQAPEGGGGRRGEGVGPDGVTVLGNLAFSAPSPRYSTAQIFEQTCFF